MNSEERERLAILEATYVNLEASVRSIELKVDRLIAVAHMGRGAFWMLMKVGGVIAILCGAAAWLFDRIGLVHKL